MKKYLLVLAVIITALSSCVSDYDRVLEIQKKFPNSIVSTNTQAGNFYVIDTINCSVQMVTFYLNSTKISNYYRIH